MVLEVRAGAGRARPRARRRGSRSTRRCPRRGSSGPSSCRSSAARRRSRSRRRCPRRGSSGSSSPVGQVAARRRGSRSRRRCRPGAGRTRDRGGHWSAPVLRRLALRASLRRGDPRAHGGQPTNFRRITEHRRAENRRATRNRTARRPGRYSQRMTCGALRIRMTRTGTPAATAFAGTSFETIVDVPSTLLSPTVTPRRIATP